MIITCLIMVGILIYDIQHTTPLFYEFTYPITLPVWALMALALVAGVVDMFILSRFVEPLSRM